MADLIAPDNHLLQLAARSVGRVNKRHRALARDLVQAMEKHGGIGMAAPQIGEMERICIVKRPAYPGPIMLFDPVILRVSKDFADHEEGCLSFPGVALKVRRRLAVVVEHMTVRGALVTTEFRGVEAACAQHEIDHLNGITFQMRAAFQGLA